MNCSKAQSLLSEYIDDRLSARDTWEVDRHLAECHACTRLLNELRRAVQAMAAAPRYEVSPDFMERLQTRLVGLKPETPRRAWFSGLRLLFRPRALPVWATAAAACALMIVFLASHRTTPPDEIPTVETNVVQTAKIQNAALSASDPMADLAAAHLAAQTDEDSLN